MYTLIISGVLFVISITISILNNKLWYKDIVGYLFIPTSIIALGVTLFCLIFVPFQSRGRYTVEREELVYKLEHLSIDLQLYRKVEIFNQSIDILNTPWLSFETEDCSDLYINIEDYFKN